MHLTDLPSELLFHIFRSLDNRSLTSVTLSCKRLRIGQKTLFTSLSVVCYQNQAENAVDFLLKTAHIRAHVQHVTVRHPKWQEFNEQEQEAQKVCRLLRVLPTLQSVWLHGHCQYVATILEAVSQRGDSVNLIIDGHLSDTSVSQFEKAVSISKSFSCGLCFDKSRDGIISTCSAVLRSCHNSSLKALKLVCLRTDEAELDREQTFRMAKELLLLSAPSLEELHLCWLLGLTRAPLYTDLMRQIPIDWPRLRRLSLNGKAMIAGLLPILAPLLHGLQCLRVSTDNHTDYHFVGSRAIRCGKPSPFLQLPRLRELCVYGSCVAFQAEYFAQPRLEVLKIHRPEIFLGHVNSRRSPEEVKRLATLAPNLKHLELDVDPIKHAFHPSAISGVDVSAKSYRVFDAIASFPHLQHLRLFPPYQNGSDSADYYNMYQQPLSDESMIRIFSAMRSKCARLEQLTVSSDGGTAYLAHEMFNFFAAKWEARVHGAQTILTTGQAFKNYEERQIWIGQRKVRSEIKRYPWLSPVAPESEEWILS